jgi:ribA/ribD-fused uncharacterized protein
MERTQKPVYLRNRDIQTDKNRYITDYDIAVATSAKVNDVYCVQRDRDLWRIYVKSPESRTQLVNAGFELGNRTIQVFDTNPYSAGTENPNEKVIRVLIKGLPISVDDDCVKKMLEKQGAKLTSDVKLEKIRHPVSHRMTDFHNGNRFVYMTPMDGKFLPKTATCAGLRCTVSHKGQPIRENKKQCTNCWAEDHYRTNCEYEACCRICKESGHSPGSNKCRFYVAEQEDIIPFAGKDNPLSNFFPTELKIFGKTYKSAEQAFQHVKALRSGDLQKAENIDTAESALDAKRFGSQVLVSDAWLDSRDEVMREILESKLKQCEEFRDALEKLKKNQHTGRSNLGHILGDRFKQHRDHPHHYAALAWSEQIRAHAGQSGETADS